MRIFLSYGHDEYASLAVRLKRDLEAHGHEVWFDLDRLKPGGDWEQYIEDGLDFSSAVPDAGRFLLLMTPHSVRRPDGYCLNELSRAYGRSLPVIPVMISTIEPPLSICRLQWLDMRNCFPADQHGEQYNRQFAQLVKALEEKQVPFEGVQQRLLNYLRPISYGDDLTRYLARFTGRKWVMNEVEKWFASGRRVLWIAGEAGVGKSALAAWLCDKRPEIAAYHFCRFGNNDRVDARRALFSLAYQLSTQLPIYQDRLNASPLEHTVTDTNVLAVFNQLFTSPLTALVQSANQQTILLIDGLDEASSNGGNELASLIRDEFDRLPPWVRLIVTSRPHEPEINFALQALDPWKLDAGREENLEDIREYLNRELRPFTGGEPSDATINAIIEKSEGLFLYVSWFHQELKDGRLSLDCVEEFPRGLGGVYAGFFQRYFPDLREYASDCKPALEAICAAREPLDRRDLARLLGWSEYKMRSLAARLGSLFPVVDSRVCPFHQSVRDWLTDSERSGPYWIDVSAQELRLADLAWKEFKAGVNTMGRYCITFGPLHLANCDRKSEVKELLLNSDWIEGKFLAAGTVPLLRDYDLALDLLSPKLHGQSSAASDAGRSFTSDSDTYVLSLVQSAIRLSSTAITQDPGQFASQMVGRLLPFRKMPAIARLVKQIAEGAHLPWLRSMRPTLHPPGVGLVRTLTGREGSVFALAVTPDGQRAVSASRNKTVKVWDLVMGRELRTFTGHSDAVIAVTVTPDGQRVISVSEYEALKVWDMSSGREVHSTARHDTAVDAVALTPDAKRAVSAQVGPLGVQFGTLKVWDVESGRELHKFTGHAGSVSGLAVTPDGERVISAGVDRTLKLWDLATGRKLHTFTGHSDFVTAVAVTPDGRRAVSGSKDRVLKVWDLVSGRELRTLRGHSKEVIAVTVTPDGKWAVSTSYDHTLRVWDLASGRNLYTFLGHSHAVTAVAVTPDGRQAVSASYDDTLKVWDLVSGRKRPGFVRNTIRRVLSFTGHSDRVTATGHSDVVTAVVVTADGRQAISASPDRTLKVWDLASGRVLRNLGRHSGEVVSWVTLAVTPDGRRAISVANTEMKLWDLGSGRELRTQHKGWGAVTPLLVMPDGQRVIWASEFGRLKVWDLRSGRELQTLRHNTEVTAVAVTADGQWVVSASRYVGLKVWDLSSGRELHTLRHLDEITAVAVMPDGQRAISASDDRTLKVWDLVGARQLCTLSGHQDRVTAVAVTPDGKRAVSASVDQTLRVWDLEESKMVATFTCDSPAYCLALSHALGLIVVGDDGGHLHFLSLEEPKSKVSPAAQVYC